jgi:ankyrin repeat protein
MLCRPPNFAVVDALFQAGADVNLLTLTLRSPLQILAEYARPTGSEDCHTLDLFVRHLIRDLGASLRYRDDQSETALHLAAEYGSCRELLEALVECDTDAVVREWKNKRK